MNVLISRRVKYTGKIFEPGTILDLPEDKAWRLINQHLAEPVQDHENTESEFLNSSRLFSKGRETGASIDDPPHIRIYAWSLINFSFAKGWKPVDFDKAAAECQLTIKEAREALNRLVSDGDLKHERERGRDYYWFAPLRWESKGEQS